MKASRHVTIVQPPIRPYTTVQDIALCSALMAELSIKIKSRGYAVTITPPTFYIQPDPNSCLWIAHPESKMFVRFPGEHNEVYVLETFSGEPGTPLYYRLSPDDFKNIKALLPLNLKDNKTHGHHS